MHPAPINGSTRLLAVIGHPVDHSLSPMMHNLALNHHGLNLRYVALPVDPANLEQAVRGFAVMGMRGFNATVPHKEMLLPLVDALSESARIIGAVNTVVIDENGRLSGHNTDGLGYITGLKQVWDGGPLAGKKVVMIGAGGAARAILYALLEQKVAQITLVNRTVSRADALLSEMAEQRGDTLLNSAALDQDSLLLQSCDLLINTSSMGLKGEFIPGIDLKQLPSSALVSDIVYGKQPTPLLQQASELGLAYQDGLAMLIHQGAEAFRLWTGEIMPVEKVEKKLRGYVEG
uniref:Shikimate dehydrogenase (NADP(+)) n=1 Tax=Magnetococcus massalia (strain MO-1) TaxID=451514 RepID=A0A1S7LLV2_MAGMO|nr:Shikimate dehydrogenase [Candidatus Magnetococcus massalia]